MLSKLNTLSILGALALFFFPWLDVRCSDRSMITQSGFQTATGTYSLSPEFREKAGDESEHRLDSGERRHAMLAAAALGTTALATLVALAGLLSTAKGGGVIPSGLLAGAALVLLLLQDSRGFPIDKELRQTRPDDPGEAIAQALVAGRIEVRRTPYYHATLGTLGFCTLLALNGLVDRAKGRR